MFGLVQLVSVLTKLIVFSPEAPRPAANADQGACEKKKKRHQRSLSALPRACRHGKAQRVFASLVYRKRF